MKYTLINRNKSTFANNNETFVKWMRKKDVQYFSSNKQFMDAYAHRKFTFEKINLRTDTEDIFVEDLLKNKLLKIDHQPKNLWKLFRNMFFSLNLKNHSETSTNTPSVH